MDKLEAIAAFVAAVWTFFKTMGWLETKRLSRLDRLFQALEIGVHSAWIHVIKPWYKENPTLHKLPEDVREKARIHAIKVAGENDDVVLSAPYEELMATLAAAVEEAKRRGGK